MSKEHLGKKLPVGDVFESMSKYASKHPTPGWGQTLPQLKPMRAGERDYFTKGKRRYYCEVLAIVKTEVVRLWGYMSNPSLDHPISSYLMAKHKKKWRFTYLVRILEN